MTFIAGAFAATFGGKYIGTTEDGFELTTSRIQEEIRVDSYRGLVDGVFQGLDMSIRFVLTEANMPAINDMLWRFDQNLDGQFPTPTDYVAGTVQACVGQLISSMSLPLILTPCGGTTAKTGFVIGAGPATLAQLTFGKAVLTPDPVTFKFASSLRRIPIAMHILPSWSSAPESTPVGTFPIGGTLGYYLAT